MIKDFKKIFLDKLYSEGADVCADYGEYYGCAWGYSSNLIEKILNEMEEEE